MKTELTIEQSQRLIELGVNPYRKGLTKQAAEWIIISNNQIKQNE